MLGAGNAVVNKTDRCSSCPHGQCNSICLVMVDFLLYILYIHHHNLIHITYNGLVLFHKFIRALTGNIQVNIPVVTVLENAMLFSPQKLAH